MQCRQPEDQADSGFKPPAESNVFARRQKSTILLGAFRGNAPSVQAGKVTVFGISIKLNVSNLCHASRNCG